jgi:FkbM family methyltransferase
MKYPLRLCKDLLKRSPVVNRILLSVWGRYYSWRMNPTRLIGVALRRCPRAFVVQIGANDGSTEDPIVELLHRNPGWGGLFVEPVPYVFDRLCASRAGSPGRFTFANVAVSDRSGVDLFYFLERSARDALPELPMWYDQLGSFDRHHIAKHFPDARVEPFVRTVEVMCLTLDELLERYRVPSMDVLHVDTEGHDWNILKQIDLSRWSPRVILFEHAHLSETEKDAATAKFALRYRLLRLARDTLCLRRD